MKPSLQHRQPPRTCAWSALLLAASATPACSVDYPLGDLSHPKGLDIDPTGAAPAQGDGVLPPTLAPPEVTLDHAEADVGTGMLNAVGDLDGDGIGDMAVIARDDVTGTRFIHVRYGGPRPVTPTEVLAFQEGGARLVLPDDFGFVYAVLRAGDVDGDGTDDLLVGVTPCDPEPPSSTYLVYGARDRMEGVVPFDNLGVRFITPLERNRSTCYSAPAIVTPGDLDGDGLDDFAITNPAAADTVFGDPLPSAAQIAERGIYVFYGRSEHFPAETSWASADAHLIVPPVDGVRTEGIIGAQATGDLDGDGRAELLVGYMAKPTEPDNRVIVVPGSAQRLSGTVEILTSQPQLRSAGLETTSPRSPADLDGDGYADLLVSADDGARLFYGAPNFFASPLDLSKAAATLESFGVFASIGDRDGDGDDELVLSQFVSGQDVGFPGVGGFSPTVVSGTRARLSGVVSFTGASNMHDLRLYSDPLRLVQETIPAGDLDGDGAADLFTMSYQFYSREDGTYNAGTTALHIHYGTPFVPPLAVPR